MNTQNNLVVTSPLVVDIQNALAPFEEEQDEGEEPPSSHLLVPSEKQFVDWAQQAYANLQAEAAELSIRIVDCAEMEALNHSYRGQAKTTNVLSFPVALDSHLTEELGLRLLGDVVICHDVVISEAEQQNKSVTNHYAHLVTHGVLHLCGYDHEQEADAIVMEALEEKILSAQGIENPYA